MKPLSSLAAVAVMLCVFTASSAAQEVADNQLFMQQVAKAGCCKVRKSSGHPWAKTSKEFGQCKKMNKKDDDKIYKNRGRVWWDRSC